MQNKLRRLGMILGMVMVANAGLMAAATASAHCIPTVRRVRVRRCHFNRWVWHRRCHIVIIRRHMCVRPLY